MSIVYIICLDFKMIHHRFLLTPQCNHDARIDICMEVPSVEGKPPYQFTVNKMLCFPVFHGRVYDVAVCRLTQVKMKARPDEQISQVVKHSTRQTLVGSHLLHHIALFPQR